MKILKKIFTPAYKKVWAKAAEELNGKYTNNGLWQTDTLLCHYKNWRILLDTYKAQSTKVTDFFNEDAEDEIDYTRMLVPFKVKGDFHFKISKKGLFGKAGKLFGTKDIQIGDKSFDKKFTIKGNNDQKIKALFDSEELRTLIKKHPHIRIQVREYKGWFSHTFPEGVLGLYMERESIVWNKNTIIDFFRIFELMLDKMVEIGVAYEDDPKYYLG